MRRYSPIQAPALAWFSRDFYRDVAENWGALALLTLVVAVALRWTVVIARAWFAMAFLVQPSVQSELAALPQFGLEQGQLFVEADQLPILIRDDQGDAIIIIDPEDSSGGFGAHPQAGILLGAREAKLRDPQQPGNITPVPYQGIPDFRFSGPAVQRFLQRLTGFGLVMMYGVGVVGGLIGRLLGAVALALMSFLLAQSFGFEIRFGQAYELSLVAMVPGLMVGTLMVFLPGSGCTLCFIPLALTIGYTLYATSCVRPVNAGR